MRLTLSKSEISNLDKNNPLDLYVINILKYKIPVGENQFLGIKRYLKLKKNRDYYLDLEEVEKIIAITNNLVIVKNSRVERFKTRDFQNFILGNLVGWKVKKTKLNLYREAYIQLARQNGKSLLLAALAIYYSGFKGFRNSRIFCAATKKDQAKIVWKNIKIFIENNKILRKKYYKIKEHASLIQNKRFGNEIIALSKDSNTLDGFDSVLGIVDEYHAHKTEDVYKLISDGQIYVDDGLIIAITTAGTKLSYPCYSQYNYCKNILNEIVSKESLFIFIADLDAKDKISNTNNWIKANPFIALNADYSINSESIERLQAEYKEALQKQGFTMTNFLTKKLNFWVQKSENDYLDKKKIRLSESEMTLEDMKNKNVYVGLDLSSGGDLTSIGFVFKLENNKYFIHSHSFMPEETIENKENISKVPYRDWIRRGLITVTPGFKTDYKFILSYLQEIIEKYDLHILELGYDPYGAGAFISDLEEITGTATSIQQSSRNLGSTVDDFKICLEGKSIKFNKDNEVLKWSLGNAKVTYNSFKEPKVLKENGNEKIDPVISIIDAWYLMFNNSEYEQDINDSFDEWLIDNE